MNKDYIEEEFSEEEIEFPKKSMRRAARRKRKFSKKYPKREYWEKSIWTKAELKMSKKRTRRYSHNLPLKGTRYKTAELFNEKSQFMQEII